MWGGQKNQKVNKALLTMVGFTVSAAMVLSACGSSSNNNGSNSGANGAGTSVAGSGTSVAGKPGAASTAVVGAGSAMTSTVQSGGAVTGTAEAAPGLPPAGLRYSQLVDWHVRNPNGDDMGKVEDLIVNLPSQSAQYLVLSLGGFLGIGEKLFTVPTSQLKTDAQNKVLILNTDKAKLQSAPNFENNKWPDLRNADWDQNIRKFWNSPAAMPAAADGVQDVRASTMKDFPVLDAKGNKLAEVKDFVFSTATAGDRSTYAILSANDKLYAAPLKALHMTAGKQQFTLNMTNDQLKQAPGFTNDKWPDLTGANWDAQAKQFWSAIR